MTVTGPHVVPALVGPSRVLRLVRAVLSVADTASAALSRVVRSLLFTVRNGRWFGPPTAVFPPAQAPTPRPRAS